MSKVVFGQELRLAVMLVIARSDGLVNPGDIAWELGLRAQSSIQDPLRDLQAAGLVSRAPRMGGKRYYRRNPSLGWAWAEELARMAVEYEVVDAE
ncbi:helix-turn-helix domain-containing protein [Tenggerimyces flavus]|uniref:MarR family transcriptional regulator n=1 Tax=Tenggerimyces flavus TaxID=1708749 RepID=A0ABV7YNK0_9ACTN|nr:MarR family transcriptional regulator [Tenggerimyces flavus]MBM7784431.1 DNA-binding transcriptional ArsR family regulator [Tenggerimyces flavus]